MADENQSQPSTEGTPTTTATTTALADGLAKATTQPSTSEGGLAQALDQAKPEVPAGPPEKYGDWKVPEGYELDKEAAADVEPLFRELGLSQDQAQKLIDAYAKHSVKSVKDFTDAGVKLWNDQQQRWRDEMKSDPQLGKLVGSNGQFGPDSPIVQTVGRALDGLQNPKLVSDFKEAMDTTGAGNNPAFVKVLYALASKVTEGTTYASGGNPVANNRRPTPGAAMYPNLPSEADRR